MGRCIGRYGRSLDDKGRVTLPSKLRRALLSAEAKSVVVLPGHEGCLYVYPVELFIRESDTLSGGSVASRPQRELRRTMAMDATEQDVDSQGRILLSDELRDYAGVARGGHVIFLGVMNFVEIWSLDRYRERVEPLRGRIDELTDKIHEEEK